MNAPQTVIVVVNWNNDDLTRRCVDALEAQVGEIYGGRDDVTVVVVDNGSSDGSADRLEANLAASRLVRLADNAGFAAGVNAAIRSQVADRYVLVNNDAIPREGFLASLLAADDSAPSDVGAITARIVLRGLFARAGAEKGDGDVLVAHDGTRWRRAQDGRQLLNSTGGVVDASGNGSDRNWLDPIDTPAAEHVFGFSGGGVLLRRRALDDVGLFDESFFMYYEDTELSWRLARRGWQVIYEKTATLDHEHAASSGTTSDLFVFRNARNRLVTALWHSSWPVVARAGARTLVRVARLSLSSSGRREGAVVARALVDVILRLPSHLNQRRRLERRASVPRQSISTGAG